MKHYPEQLHLDMTLLFSLNYYKPSIIWKSDIYFDAAISYGSVTNKSSTS